MKPYFICQRAQLDLIDIWDFIAQDNEVAADRILQKIKSRIELLAQFNDLGTPKKDVRDSLRFSTVRNYVIYYEPIGDCIEILRVVHGSRDAEDLF